MNPSKVHAPGLSVVVFSCDEDSLNLPLVLKDLLNQEVWRYTYGEIIVMFSGSPSNASLISNAIRGIPGIKLVINERRLGKSVAINESLKLCTRDFILLISGDVRIPSNCFKRLLDEMLERNCAAVCPRVVPFNRKENSITRIASLYWLLHDRFLKDSQRRGFIVKGGECILMRRELIPRVPEKIVNDDAYIILHVWLSGRGTCYCHSSMVANRVPTNLKELINQRARINYGHRQLKKLLRVPSPTLTSSAYRRPLITFKILIGFLADVGRQPKNLLRFLTLLIIELLSILASYRSGKEPHIWRPAITTKYPMRVRAS